MGLGRSDFAPLAVPRPYFCARMTGRSIRAKKYDLDPARGTNSKRRPAMASGPRCGRVDAATPRRDSRCLPAPKMSTMQHLLRRTEVHHIRHHLVNILTPADTSNHHDRWASVVFDDDRRVLYSASLRSPMRMFIRRASEHSAWPLGAGQVRSAHLPSTTAPIALPASTTSHGALPVDCQPSHAAAFGTLRRKVAGFRGMTKTGAPRPTRCSQKRAAATPAGRATADPWHPTPGRSTIAPGGAS